MTVRKIRAGRVTTVTMDQFVGDVGTLFYDENTGEMRLSNGVEPGGNIVSYVLPIASNVVLGGIKLGTGFTIDANGVVSVIGGGNVISTVGSANIAVYDEGNLVASSIHSINFVGATVTANASNSNVTVTVVGNNVPLTSDRITSGASNLVINGMGAQPSVIFPVGPAGQIIISEAEISTLSGNLALTSMGDAYVLANGNGAAPGGAKLWRFDSRGNVTFPGGSFKLKENPYDFSISTLAYDEETNLSWTFDKGGHFNVPVSIEFDSLTEANTVGTIFSQPDGLNIGGYAGKHVKIAADDGTAIWTFGTNGNLSLPGDITFPDGTIQSTAIPDRIKSNTAQLVINGMGSQPSVIFPVGPAGQIAIAEAEITALSGNLVLSSMGDTYIFANGDGAAPGALKTWKLDRSGNLTLPQTDMNASPAPISLPGITFTDGTFQTTAYTGTAGRIDITNTNGLTTTYYPTFVESRTNGQDMRADVDLTYRTDTNLLKLGNIQVGKNIYGSYLGGISDAIQLKPDIDIDKRFLFTVDSNNGTYLRSTMEMPVAEVNRSSTLGFPHNNGHVGYIYSQGSDANGTEFNNAFNIMSNGVDLKLSAFNSNDKYVWTFDVKGNITLPQTDMNASPAPTSLPGITYTDGTRQTTAFTGTPTELTPFIRSKVITSGGSFSAYGITIAMTGSNPYTITAAVSAMVGGQTVISSPNHTGGISTNPTSIFTITATGQSCTAIISDVNTFAMYRVTVQNMIVNDSMYELTMVAIEQLRSTAYDSGEPI